MYLLLFEFTKIRRGRGEVPGHSALVEWKWTTSFANTFVPMT